MQTLAKKPLSRKQREIQQREAQILAIARPMLVRDGYASLSMDRLAVHMEYAKGTLYNHFPNKEEIVAALAIESLELRRQMFEQASTLEAGSRQRMMAIGAACEKYATECHHHFAVELMLRHSIIWDKASDQRRQVIRTSELRAMGVVAGVVRDAVASGDLHLPEMTPEEFVFGFWSLTFGSHVLSASSPSLADIGITRPLRCIRYHGWTLINGYGWQPLLSFEETDRRMTELAQRISLGAQA